MEEDTDLFGSAWLKWGWASAHAEVLKSEVRDFTHQVELDGGLTATSRYDAKRHCLLIVGRTVPDFPLRIGLILGDVIQGYRSALDHLAWALVKRGRTPNLSKDAEKKVYFPYAVSPKHFRNSIRAKLPGVRRADIAKVRRYQPYQAGKRMQSRHPFSALEKLSNHDKHRTIQPLWALPIGMQFKIDQLYDCVITRIPKHGRLARLEVDAEFARIYVRRTGPNPGADMQGRLQVEPFIDEFMLLSDWLAKTTAFSGSLLREFAEPPEDLIDTIAPKGTEHVFP
jgi:hypothetical protein